MRAWVFATPLLVVLAGVLVGASIRLVQRHEAPSSTVPDSSAATPRVDSITGVLKMLPDADVHKGREVIVLLLRRSDWGTCEDIGRQLRELTRAAANERMELFIIVHHPDSLAVAAWLRREGVKPRRILQADLDRPITSEGVVGTPAAMLVAPDGTIRIGVSHVEGVPNHRATSFVEELGLSTGTHRSPVSGRPHDPS